jgi:hypothetical protein
LRTFMNQTYKSKIIRIKKDYENITLPDQFDKDKFCYSCYKFCNSNTELEQVEAESLFCCELFGIMSCKNQEKTLLPIFNLARQKTKNEENS